MMPMLLAKSFVRGRQGVAPKFKRSRYQLIAQNSFPAICHKPLLGRAAGCAQLMVCYRVAKPSICERVGRASWSIVDDKLPVAVRPKPRMIIDKADQIPFGHLARVHDLFHGSPRPGRADAAEEYAIRVGVLAARSGDSHRLPSVLFHIGGDFCFGSLEQWARERRWNESIGELDIA